MHSADYFHVGRRHMAPMAKDIKAIDFTDKNWKYSVWTKERYPYLQEVIAAQNPADGAMVVVAKAKGGDLQLPQVGSTLALVSKQKAELVVAVAFAGLAAFPYSRSRKTALMILVPQAPKASQPGRLEPAPVPGPPILPT